MTAANSQFSPATAAAPGQEPPPPPSEWSDEFQRSTQHFFRTLTPQQFAVLHHERWRAFDTLSAAREYAKECVSEHPASEIQIYDARQQFVKSVLNGQAQGGTVNLPAAAPWWKFWR